jgi:hypothetical protein
MKMFIAKILIPFILIMFWIFAPIFLLSDSSLSVITSNYSKSIFTNFRSMEILKGQIVQGNFVARENNLGIVSVRFNNFEKINSDSLIFKIKEKDASDWYYSGKYKVDQFQPNDFFTFGFPKIANSINKEYTFQLESVSGTTGDAVALSDIEPVMQTKYQFSKADILQNKAILPRIVLKKILYAYADLNFFVSSLPFLLPFVVYALFLKFRFYILKNRSLHNLYGFTLILILFLFIEHLLPGFLNLFFALAWIILIVRNKLESSISFLYVFILLDMAVILIFVSGILIAENFAIWAYYFMVIGIIQVIYEQKRKPTKQVTYADFMKDIIGEKLYKIIYSKMPHIV